MAEALRGHTVMALDRGRWLVFGGGASELLESLQF